MTKNNGEAKWAHLYKLGGVELAFAGNSELGAGVLHNGKDCTRASRRVCQDLGLVSDINDELQPMLYREVAPAHSGTVISTVPFERYFNQLRESALVQIVAKATIHPLEVWQVSKGEPHVCLGVEITERISTCDAGT